MLNSARVYLAFLILFSIVVSSFADGIHPAPGLPQTGQVVPFFPHGTYDSQILSPEKALGFVMGARAVRYDQVVSYISLLEQASSDVLLKEYGETYEGRKLYYLIISSRENLERIDQIQNEIGLLADPRQIKSEAEARKLTESLPAICWMSYSIHGDELSSTDAALQLAYQLAAGTDTLTKRLKENLVVIIDPLQNPDGRERILSQIQSFSGKNISLDVQSLPHSGVWPWGRGNHYLFDLNRDWFALVHPESRGKIKAILEWNPQVLVDCHEMGSFDTYLFSPPREPFNPFMISTIHKWWKIFSQDQARAFDRYGWSYYTREWNEEWFPGYGSSWSIFLGAVGILYEQAGAGGLQLKRPDGTILTYRESVHHQFTSSMANLITSADHRRELLSDYYQEKKRAVSDPDVVTYIFEPGQNQTRTEEFVNILLKQKIEVRRAEREFSAGDLTDIWHNRLAKKLFPKGTYFVSSSQPLSHLVKAILEFDLRMPTDFLEQERKELEKGRDTKLYEVTSWSVPLAYNLNAYRTAKSFSVPSELLSQIEEPKGELHHPRAGYGFVFDYTPQGAVLAVARLLEQEYKIRMGKKSFTVEGLSLPAGSVLLRQSENGPDLPKILDKLAEEYGIDIYGVNTALAEEGADLGGGEFELLQKPKIGLLANSPISPGDFGAIWHLLDQKLDMRISTLDIAGFNRLDLSLYNALVFPSSFGGGEEFTRILGKGGLGKLKGWIEGGGTLIAIGSAAAFCADTSSGISQVRLRGQVLDSLSAYERDLKNWLEADQFKLDSASLWEPKEKEKSSTAESEKKETKPELDKLREADQKGELFMPRGAILRVNLDVEHWLSYGAGDKVPVLVYTDKAFLSKSPVQSAGRFADAPSLRLAGLLWPEARQRWANTSYLTRESKGKGQIILFATQPNFRGYFLGAERLLVNALLLGPGLGAAPPRLW